MLLNVTFCRASGAVGFKLSTGQKASSRNGVLCLAQSAADSMRTRMQVPGKGPPKKSSSWNNSLCWAWQHFPTALQLHQSAGMMCGSPQ